MDGVDASDDSIQGIMKYLVYRKRKSLDFQKEMLLLRYTSSSEYDPNDVIKHLTEEWYPSNPEESMIEIAVKSKELQMEVSKKMVIKPDKDGNLKLHIG